MSEVYKSSVPGASRRIAAAIATPAPIALESRGPLAIDDAVPVLRVVRGHVDLFAVEQLDGVSTGQRHHLFRVEAGAMIFGLPGVAHARRAIPISVIAVGGQDAQIVVEDRDRCSDPGLIDAWVTQLSSAIASTALDTGAELAEIGSRPELAKGQVLCAPGHRVVWVAVERGAVRLMEEPKSFASDDPPLPLASGTWLTADDGSVLSVQESNALAAAEIWAGLDQFHALAIACLSDRIAAAAIAESQRLQSRSRLDRLRANRIFGHLAGIIDRRSAGSDIGAVGANEVLAACREVGNAMGIAIAPPANMRLTSRDIADVFLIAQASRVRARRVLLRKNWWNGSVGPLVAFYRNDRRAVAILQGTRNRHIVVDPMTGARRDLTGAVALEMAPEAVMFYRALPSRALLSRDLMRFGAAIVGADFFRIMLASLGVGILTMAVPLVTKILIDSVIPRAEINQLVICALALAIAAIVAAGFQIMQGIAVLRLESLLDWELQAAIIDRLLRMPALFFRQYSAGDLADRALGIEAVRTIITGRAIRGLLASVSCLFSFTVMFYYDYRLAFIAAALAIFRGAIVIATSLVRLRHERVNFDLQGWLQGVVLQFLAGVGKLRVANATTHALALWVGRFTRQKRHFIASQRAANLLMSFEAAFPAVATLIIFAVGERISSLSLFHDLGSFLAFFAAFGLSLAGVGELATAAAELLIAVPRIGRLKPIISTATEIGEDRKAIGELAGSIEFAQVSFRYGEGGPLILHNVSMSVDKGEYLAIVGPSGSGKSTLFRLLLGFEKPESGAIFVDGRSVETIDISMFRRQIGVVLQNSRLASGSIYENICAGTQLRIEQVWEAARLVGLDADIEAMPMGMHTMVAEGVSTLSGGQRQRLLIARAIVRRPRILLLDEATSALDNRTQAIVTETVSQLNVTRIVIAHRLSTVQSADRIVVLAGGSFVQTGSFAELMAQPGLFAEFAVRQLI
jgi:NHLM bacteriocin system ABC transporter ATP-binding protein